MMKNKLLLLLSVVMILIGWGCGGPPPPPPCPLSCESQHLYFVVYNDTACPGNYVTLCVNGFIYAARDCHSNCNITLVERQFLNVALTADPSTVYLPSPPASINISGQSFSQTYAMPMVEYFDDYGYFLGSALATYVSGDGTVLTVPAPNLSAVYSGAYLVRVTNKTGQGYYAEVVGGATIYGWGRDRPDSDGDGWYDDEDCYPYDYSRWDCNDPGCINNHIECNVY